MELKNLIAEGVKVDVYESDGSCVKVFKDDEPKSVVLYEALTHSRVEETGYDKIPELREIARIKDKWAIIYRFVNGKTFASIMRENSARTDEYLEKMADLQLEIHSLHSGKLSRQKDYLKRSIDSLDMIDDVKKYELLSMLAGKEEETKLCHGEFSPENIIEGSDGTFVVDWLKAKQGSPYADVAKTYLNFCLSHHTEWAEKYLNIYCRKSGAEPRDIREWLPIVAAAQLKFKRPEERELLLAWIGLTDYGRN